MAWSSVFITLLGTAAITSILSYQYSNWSVQNASRISVHIISWWLPALILTTLPIDITTAFYSDCLSDQQSNNLSAHHKCHPPPLYLGSEYLLIFWYIVYWSSQALTWIVLPIMRSYVTAGDFTIWAKLRTAVFEQLIQYISYLVIFITILCYLLKKGAVSMNFEYLKVLLITSCNTWGLFIVILFLGYGLVEVPRNLWIAGNPSANLHRAYFLLNERHVEHTNYEEKLGELMNKIGQVKAKLRANHPWQSHLLTIEKQAQLIQPSANVSHRHGLPRNHSSSNCDHSVAADISMSRDVTLKDLVDLHKNVKTIQYRYGRARALYEEAVRKAVWIEDVVNARQSCGLSVFPQDLDTSLWGTWLHRRLPRCLTVATSRLLHIYYCHLRFWLLRALGLVLGLVSLLMVWSECTLSIRSPKLSLVAILVDGIATKRDYFLLELAGFFTLGYLAVVVFYSVFCLRLFNYYRLVGGHHTDEYSLLFCGALLCRLTPSLCLNFLGMAHLDSHLTATTLAPLGSGTVKSGEDLTAGGDQPVETTYTKFMGHLDVITFIADGFNLYFPLLVLLLCLLTCLRVGSRLLRLLGVPQHLLLMESYGGSLRPDRKHNGLLTADDLVHDAIHDGKLLLRQERMQMSRHSRTEFNPDSSDTLPMATRHKANASFDRSSRRTRGSSPDRVHLLSPGVQSPERDLATSDSSRTMYHDEPVEYSEEAVAREFDLLK